MDKFILILMAAIGAAGFSILFHVKATHIPLAALGGAVTYAVYVFIDSLGTSLFISSLGAALISVIYSNIMARVVKTPSTIFITACIIPLVPGGSLFNTMNHLILWNREQFLYYGGNTVQIALGIAGGIVVESSIVYFFEKIFSRSGKITKST